MKDDIEDIDNTFTTPNHPFAEEFDALLAEICTGEPISRLEEEIEQLKGAIAANLKRAAVGPEELQRLHLQLTEVKSSLKDSKDRLEAFITAPEVAEIEASRQRAAENRTKMERIALFDEYFKKVGELEQCLAEVKKNFGDQEKTGEAEKALVKAKQFLKEIGEMKNGLFPPKSSQYPKNLVLDFEQVFDKLTTDVDEWMAVLMPERSMATSNVEELKNESVEKSPHQEFVIRTKKLLASFSSASDQLLTTELISSEVLASFKLGQNSKISRLPPLKISHFMVEIKEVIEEMSALFSKSSSESDTNLLAARETFADVCELFLSTAPYLFRSRTERDPRRSAVAHNNCVFFAHLVEAVQQAHRPHLNLLTTEPTNYIQALRELASTIFRQQMQFEEARLLSVVVGETPSALAFSSALAEIANETPATELKVSSAAHFDFRRTLNDCLRLLGSLRDAFQDVLPEKLCGRAFSTLVSSLLSAFLGPIVALNDISSLGASHLAHELDYFSGELQPFLAGASGSVSKWIKMNEVNFILKSSLLEIVNRWADGSGLLASYLTAEEVKHLVRALFQNTERRSKALAKIK